MVTVAAAPWVLPVLVVFVMIALGAAAFDAVLANRRPGALLIPGDEMARLLRQRRRTTVSADSPLWRIGGGGLIVAALLMVVVIPVGGVALTDLSVGVVWFNTMDVAVWALVWLTGWGANSAHSLVGGYRFLAQALAYELPLMFALTAPAVGAASLRLADVVAAQQGLWFVVWMPVAFVVYLIGVVGFSVWGPLNPAAGRDIAGGILAELSGVDRLLVLAGRYALLSAGAAFAVPMFLGGSAGLPWLAGLLPGWVWFTVKWLLLLACLVATRRRIPTIRPDRFVEAGWLVLLPVTLVQLLVVSTVVVLRS